MTLTLLNNRYRIIRALGAGGFGNTFLAEDTYMPSARRCVIKQLKPVTHDPQAYQIAQQRFGREAAVLEELGEKSNQIPKLYAYFSEGGQFYLVQEWIEGDTLTNKVQQQGVFSEAAVRDILVSLLPVLEYVHSKRIIHRDIKPDNIILRERDTQPVLIDFGAVKEAMGSAMHSIAIGTPGFMASEQIAGQPVYSSDLYSLGLTAVYLLTGKIPQELPNDSHTGEIVWHSYARSVSASLAAVLDKAIRHYPAHRYSTAREMLDALQSGVASPSRAMPATASTVVVSPAAPHPAGSSPQHIPVIAPPGNRGQGFKRWLTGILIVAGLFGAVVALSRILNRSPQPSPQVSSSSPSPTSASEPIASEQTPSQTPANSPTDPNQETPPPVISESPTPAPIQSPSPVPIQSPTPAPTGENNDRDRNPSTSVPAFPTGTARSTVEASLGKPIKDARGVWGNTRAVVYQFVPDRIDLGYLFDRNSGRLRQTEVSFAQSVDLQVMLTALDGLLNGEATTDIKRGLQRVQQGKSNSFTFSQGSVKGQIVRQDCDFIYISIWDAELHDFNVASSRKC